MKTRSIPMRMSVILIAAVFVFAPALSGALQAADIPEDMRIDLDSLTVSKSEFICLALNDYWEARGEKLDGRLAVAKVVLNRAMDSRFPTNLCSVIKQNKAQVLHRCQFSWYCDGRSDTPFNRIAWRSSLKLAAAVLQKDSSIADPTEGALWYHAAWVHPAWADYLDVSSIVGGHIFYRDPESIRLARGNVQSDPMIPALHRFSEWTAARRDQAASTTVASR